MTGSRLEAEVYLVTVLSSVAAEPAEVRRAGRVSTSASSCSSRWRPRWRCSRRDERELGCAIVELGGGSTNVAIFHDGKIRHTASLLFAGGHVTNDIVHGLQVTQQDAERLKERFGAGVRAAGARRPTSSSCRARRARAPGPRTAGCSRTSCTCGCRKCWSYALDEISGPGITSGCPPASS